MSLYLTYRPNAFDELRGNEAIVTSLRSLLADKTKAPHTYLLYGPTGCGKTTLARIIAKELECSEVDYREIDSADFRGIDTVREIRKQSAFKPLQGDVRVWVIDECHKMTNDAQNALLKILEDTPSHIYFVLCTTEANKLIPTILGRCSQFQVSPLNERQMFVLLRGVVHAEGHKLDKEVYDQIIQDSQGLPRNALQILEQVLSVPEDKRLEMAKRTAEQQSQVIELCRLLVKGSTWRQIAPVLTGLKQEDAENIRRSLLGYCQAVLLREENDFAAAVIESLIEPLYNIGFPGLVYACYSVTKR